MGRPRDLSVIFNSVVYPCVLELLPMDTQKTARNCRACKSGPEMQQITVLTS